MGKLAGQKWPALADSRPPVVLPLGSCEQHGPHPPLDADQRVAEAVAPRATTAHHGLWRLGGYCAAQQGHVLGLVRALVCDLQGAGVDAIAVSPGSTRPPSRRRPRTSTSSAAPNNSQITQLACRLLEPEEVTSVVAWACSPDAGDVTRSVLHADRDP
jgi:NAD(P)-dependent dehydrogenase (short-subunit alcohol dehydrogenase family)